MRRFLTRDVIVWRTVLSARLPFRVVVSVGRRW